MLHNFKSKNLQELADELNQIDLGGEDAFHFFPYPTFGGKKPKGEGNFSWNETHRLVCMGTEWGKQWQLQKRREIA